MGQKLTIQGFRTAAFDAAIPGLLFTADFNPGEYTLTRANRFDTQATSGTSRPEATYDSGVNDTLRIAFTFDGTGVRGGPGDPGSVSSRVSQLLRLMEYRGTLHQPPYVKVTWGELAFQGRLVHATVTYTLFDNDGRPIRAKVDAQFEEAVAEAQRLAQERTSSPSVDRVWPLVEGDRLDRIAHEMYGHTGYWVQLATANHLPTARRLPRGGVLALPRLDR